MNTDKLFDGLYNLTDVVKTLVEKGEILEKRVTELEKRVERLEKRQTGTYPQPLPGSPAWPPVVGSTPPSVKLWWNT